MLLERVKLCLVCIYGVGLPFLFSSVLPILPAPFSFLTIIVGFYASMIFMS